ncbi:MAG: TIGR04283 family arsenosugar biosynthesis glycosyltransferase [Candidatus Thiodiazotropha sp.]
MASAKNDRDPHRISIILPTLNEGPMLERCLQDLQPLRRDGHELIVVDGGSQWELPRGIESLVDRLLQSPPGRARQMNSGAMKASGEIYWFLHADSRISDALVEAIVEAAGPGIFWGRFDVRLSGSHPLFRIIERMMNWRSRLSGIATGDQGIFVDRHLFTRVGGFPEQPLMEDVEISRRLKRIVPPFNLPGPLLTSSRRWESHGILRTILLMWMLRLAYWLGISPRHLARLYAPGTD